MTPTKPTVAQRIEALAKSTAAPVEFVRKVRDLFSKKGIALEASAEPFEAWLERAFARQADAQRQVVAADPELSALPGNIAEVNRGFREQIEKLKRLRREVESHTRRIAVSVSPIEEPIERSRLVRGEWDLTFVPGPEGEH